MLGLQVEPHKAMRAAAMGNSSLLGDPNGVYSCCDCGLCTFYACNFGLNPSGMMQKMKQGLSAAGYKPIKQVKSVPNTGMEYTRVPVSRLVGRLGLSEFDVPAPLVDKDLPIHIVRISLKQHIGAPSVPSVKAGDEVKRGDMIGEIKQGALGARAHASIDGVVTEVTGDYIEIKARR
jgi:Na+-translocating ferredoxin:NAD+ oxidoreductase RnfC subunit